MRRVTPRLFLGNVGEFGDAGNLEAASVELAFLCHAQKGFPHTADIPTLAVSLRADGLSPDWYVQGLAKFLAAAYQFKTLSVHDDAGGMTLAAFLVCCAAADKLNTSFNTQLTVLQAVLGLDMKIPAALAAQGVRIWP